MQWTAGERLRYNLGVSGPPPLMRVVRRIRSLPMRSCGLNFLNRNVLDIRMRPAVPGLATHSESGSGMNKCISGNRSVFEICTYSSPKCPARCGFHERDSSSCTLVHVRHFQRGPIYRSFLGGAVGVGRLYSAREKMKKNLLTSQ